MQSRSAFAVLSVITFAHYTIRVDIRRPSRLMPIWSVWQDLNLRFSAPKADDFDRASLHTE